MMEFKKPKLFGKDEDGYYEGQIEQIGTAKDGNVLYISNRRAPLWVFSLFNGYRQIGTYKTTTEENNKFKEGDLVIAEKKDDKIIKMLKEVRNVTTN